jgi:PAS domain S-box-containing protein
MSAPSSRKGTLSPLARTGIACGLSVGIAAIDQAYPSQHLAYAQIVPLILLARVFGLRAAVVASIGAAIGFTALDHRGLAFAPGVATEALLLGAVYVAVIYVVEHYEEVLVRSYRTEAELLAAENEEKLRELKVQLPAAVRREEAAARERDLSAIAEAIPQLVWRSRGDGTAEYFNNAWFAYTGLQPNLSHISGIEMAIHPDDAPLVLERWNSCLLTGEIYDVEYRLRGRDGAYRWFLSRATPLRDRFGVIVRWFGTCTDIDAQKRAQAQLERQFELAHRVSEAFQQASLPSTLPSVPGLRFSALYRAGRREAAVGGDWYDALRLLDGRVVVSIGDVAGSGLVAAITMVAMRQAIRGAAQIHPDPVAILEAADRTLREDGLDRMVTAFVGVFDPVTRAFTYASAGHPAPLLRMPNGTIEELAAPGLPLGVRRKGDTEARETLLEPGSFLVMFTDGLIESTHDIMAGDRGLRDALKQPGIVTDPKAADRIAALVLADGARDDVAVLTLGFDRRVQDDRYMSRTFDSSDAAAARDAHDALVVALVAAGANDAQLADAEVAFAELIGNVVRHARGPVEVVLDASGTLPVLSVLDRGRGFVYAPHLPADMFAEAGRGLYIVRSLTAEFNASRRPNGGTHARAVLFVDRFAVAKQRAVRPAIAAV